MFFNCSKLLSFKADNITNMSKMFDFCKKLFDLNLSSFNINNVSDSNMNSNSSK